MPEISKPDEHIDHIEMLLGPDTLDILQAGQPADIQIASPWHRGGSETYVSDFWVRREDKNLHLIAKACVTFSAAEVMQDWCRRREVIAENDIEVPALYYRSRATIVEEFIPFCLKEQFQQAREERVHVLGEKFTELVIGLGRLGFSPISLHDLRSRGDDVVVVDFGSDLGGQTGHAFEISQEAADTQLQKFISKS